uniref:Uncharacterized protein n=1 Tax=Arundo donax TaxID=35708 RepID=A0A0A8YRS6_ARUDO
MRRSMTAAFLLPTVRLRDVPRRAPLQGVFQFVAWLSLTPFTYCYSNSW